MKKAAIIITTLVAFLATVTTVEAVEVKNSTLRIDWKEGEEGSWAMWGIWTISTGTPVDFCPIVIVREGSADLYAFGGISTPIGLSLSIGPGISVNADDRVGFIENSSGWVIACYSYKRLGLNSFNALYFPRHDNHYYWGRKEANIILVEGLSFYVGARTEGCLYFDGMPKDITVGPTIGFRPSEKCRLSTYIGVNPDDSVDRTLGFRIDITF